MLQAVLPDQGSARVTPANATVVNALSATVMSLTSAAKLIPERKADLPNNQN